MRSIRTYENVHTVLIIEIFDFRRSRMFKFRLFLLKMEKYISEVQKRNVL